MVNPQIKFTYRDYLLLPEQDRRELIYGDFYVVPSPNTTHQTIVLNLGLTLGNFVRRNELGVVLLAPMDVVLDQENVIQPDVLFVSNEHRHIIGDKNISGAPDLVIEILSPSTAERDRELKLGLYARFGVSEYWIVDPDERSAQVMKLGTGRYDSVERHDSGTVSSTLLPGLAVSVDEIFAEH